MMKNKLFILILVVFSFMGIAISSNEVVSFALSPSVQLRLEAENIESKSRKNIFGICIFRDQLWSPTMFNPPEKILISGILILNGKKINLDVNGLATPWVMPKEMSPSKCLLTEIKINDNDVYYELKIAFFKGGALDYFVTWLIYEGHSLRIEIKDVGDTYPEWYEKNYNQKNRFLSTI